jgi:hypothetical protein
MKGILKKQDGKVWTGFIVVLVLQVIEIYGLLFNGFKADSAAMTIPVSQYS